MRTIPPPAPNANPGRIIADGPDGLRYRTLRWKNRRHLVWHVPGLAVWWIASRSLLGLLTPHSPALGINLLVLVIWALPSLLITLHVSACRAVRDITVRPGWIELEDRVGGKVHVEQLPVASLEILDPATARLRIEPGSRVLELLPSSRRGHWFASRVRSIAATTSRANEEAASGETASFAGSDLEVGV